MFCPRVDGLITHPVAGPPPGPSPQCRAPRRAEHTAGLSQAEGEFYA